MVMVATTEVTTTMAMAVVRETIMVTWAVLKEIVVVLVQALDQKVITTEVATMATVAARTITVM